MYKHEPGPLFPAISTESTTRSDHGRVSALLRPPFEQGFHNGSPIFRFIYFHPPIDHHATLVLRQRQPFRVRRPLSAYPCSGFQPSPDWPFRASMIIITYDRVRLALRSYREFPNTFLIVSICWDTIAFFPRWAYFLNKFFDPLCCVNWPFKCAELLTKSVMSGRKLQY